MYKEIADFIKGLYPGKKIVPLHEPVFTGNEKKYLAQCIDSTYVSYVGAFVTRFEEMIKDHTGAKYAVAMANGTLALHTALMLAGVEGGDEVLIPALTFVATANAAAYCGASPVFIDSERATLGMSPDSLNNFLKNETRRKKDGHSYNRKTGERIAACVPVHVFGHPCRIDEIRSICDKYNIALVEDAAESIGSSYRGRHTGLFGRAGVLSFNGNKIITTGGGGMIITDDRKLALKAKHMSTTAKVPHKWEFIHDQVGYNYRLPNVNAAIGCAQMENLTGYLKNKRELAGIYSAFFNKIGIEFINEPEMCRSNYWLNSIIVKNRRERDEYLAYLNSQGIMARPAWRLLSQLRMYRNCHRTELNNAEWLEDRIINIPSSVRM